MGKLPPGHRLAVQTFDGISVIEGGTTVDVPGSTGAGSFAWSPDASAIWITRGDTTLAYVPLDGSPVREAAGDWEQVRFPAPSPVGPFVAVTANRTPDLASGWEIWLLDIEADSVRVLGPGYNPAWSPDGRTIHFELFEPSVHLATQRLDGGRASPLFGTTHRDIGVAISPQGTFAAFARGHERQLMLYSFADAGLLPLTDGTAYDQYPSFSHDERFVVFHRQIEDPDAPPALQIISCDLSDGRTLLIREGDVLSAAFAPAPAGL